MKLAGTAVTGFMMVIMLLVMNGMLSIGILGEYVAANYDEVKEAAQVYSQLKNTGGPSGKEYVDIMRYVQPILKVFRQCHIH